MQGRGDDLSIPRPRSPLIRSPLTSGWIILDEDNNDQSNSRAKVFVLIPRSPRTRLNVEKQGEGREDLMTMEIIF